MGQFWPVAETVQRRSFVTGSSPTAVTFSKAFAGVPDLSLVLIVTAADAFLVVTALTATGFTAGALASGAWFAGYTIRWSARGAVA